MINIYFVSVNNKNMKKLFKNKAFILLIPITILMIYSILNMINAGYIMNQYSNYYIKQLLWFAIGFFIVGLIYKFNIVNIFKYSYFLYALNVLLLILVLFFGKEVNGARAWFDLSYFSFQPSEFMKLSLILTLANVSNSLKFRTIRNELIFIMKVIVLTLIPSILTFLQPDTGAVIIYFIIALVILFAARIRTRWFVISLGILLVFSFSFFYFYHNYQDQFINIFGTSFFYRMDRLIEFSDGRGMQIENALTAIGSAGWFGSGIRTVAIYFPEAPTDFIFALSISNFGFFGAIIILLSYLFMFIILIKLFKKIKKKERKMFIIAFLGMFLYQTIQSVLMNIGLMPIIGITLPFLSYGGSSTLLYFICIGLIIKFSRNQKEKYPNWIF